MEKEAHPTLLPVQPPISFCTVQNATIVVVGWQTVAWKKFVSLQIRDKTIV